MNCVYTYNGRDYSYAEFAAALHEGLLEDLSAKGEVVLDVEIPKIETRIAPVAKDGKIIIDEQGNLTNELQSQFESLKDKGDAQGLNDLYSTVRIFLNGIAQSKGDKAVSQLEGLKKQIEDYAKEFKGEAVEEGNAQKEEVAEKEEEKEVVSPTEQVEQPAEFEEVKQAKEKFYKHTEDKGYVEVKRAKPVYIFGTEKAFYVKEGKEFVVSDAITGAEIGRGSTLNNAVASAEENAGSVQNLESARERFTDAYGKSPYAKLQEEFSFTQSIINNAMDAAEDGIQDMTLDDMEDKGIIKRDCE